MVPLLDIDQIEKPNQDLARLSHGVFSYSLFNSKNQIQCLIFIEFNLVWKTETQQQELRHVI